jgi:hypothetical protein
VTAGYSNMALRNGDRSDLNPASSQGRSAVAVSMADPERAHRHPSAFASTPVRWWTILLGLALLPPNAYWIAQMEEVRQGPYPTIISLFANCVFALLLLQLANRPLKRWVPRAALSRAELLTVYTMLCIGSALSGLDMIPVLMQMMGHPFRFADASNGWMGLFGRYLPRPLMVNDPDVLRSFYSGSDSLYRAAYLRAWLPPVLRWCLFIFALLFVMFCISVIVRRQWMDRERLTFPIVMLPLHMTEEGGRFWRNGLLWIGIGVAGGIDLLAGLNFLFPSIPFLNVKHVDLLPYIRQKPWNAVGWTPYSLYPFVIGIGYLLPLDLVFSCWFFYIFWKMELVLANAMSWDTIPDFPFIREQAFGGYIAILVFMGWTARGYLKAVWRQAWERGGELDDSQEALSYRTALVGAGLGLAFIAAFLWHYGMSPVWAVAAVLIYLCLTISIARMRAELGPPVHDLHFSGPDHILTRAFGTSAFDGNSLAMLNMFYWFNRAYRSHPMPILLEGQKISGVTEVSLRRTALAMMLAVVVGSLASFWAFLHLAYRLGTAAKFTEGTWFAWEAYNRLAGWVQNPTHSNIPANWAMVIGFGFCSLLMAMRLRYFWWPFHPIGFAISGSWSMNLVWLPLMIAWLLKLLILRYGALRMYKRYEPLFLGLIIGEFVVGCLWSLIGIAFGIPTYSFWGA